MIDSAASGVQPDIDRGSSCPWLDNLRGPEGANHVRCRLTTHIFGIGRLQDAACLALCAYPAQYARGACQHMDVANVLNQGDPPLPRIHCRAHHRYDAPGLCQSCPDYLAPTSKSPDS